MLRQFVSLSRGKKGTDANDLECSQSSEKRVSSVHGGNVWNTFKSTRKMAGHAAKDIDYSTSRRGADLTVRSQSGRGMRRINTATVALSSL
jgi:hypothetical protein